jgi:hypothetical protein
MRPVARISVLLILAASAGCDSDAGPTIVQPKATHLQSSTLTPVNATVGSNIDPIVVQARDAQGHAVPDAAIRWSVETGGGTLLFADTLSDGSGNARAVWRLGTMPGTNRLSVALVGVTPGGSLEFATEAVPGAPGRISIQPTTPVGIPVGQTFTFTASISDSFGNQLQGWIPAWSSSVPAVAEVDGNGRVTGRTVGIATITARVGSAAASVNVQINP